MYTYITRAKHLAQKGHEIFANSSLVYFLNNNITKNDFEKDNTALNHFAAIDDNDIWSAIKEWQNSDDDVLSMLANGLINRDYLKLKYQLLHFLVKELKMSVHVSPNNLIYLMMSWTIWYTRSLI